jgi:hypothetical protein
LFVAKGDKRQVFKVSRSQCFKIEAPVVCL